jgi:hypothetical protein
VVVNRKSMIIHVSIPVFYEFDGWKFEYSRTKPFGPWPLKKDFEPRARAGKKFYQMFGRFIALPEKEQEKFRV